MTLSRRILLSLGACAIVAAPALAGPDDDLIAKTEARYKTRLDGGQYMKQNCSDITLEGWQGVPLVRCRYTELETSAEVTLALPDAGRLARWTVTACKDAGAADMQACARHIERRIWSASNAQFPVSGFVIEPRSVLGGSSNDPYCFLFRNGVTVRTASVSAGPPQGGKCVPQSAENDPVTRALKYARIASTTRAEFALAQGAPAEAALAGTAFLDAVRNEFVAAWSVDRNRLISGAAIADKAAGKFR